MRSSKQNISKSYIEKEIYNTFEIIENKKKICIADFLNKLEINSLVPINYRSIKFSCESLIKLIIFQKLKGMKFQTQLIRYLKRHRNELKLLGLDEIPDQTTISYFINHILDNETKELLNYTTKKIEEISEKFDIILDIQIPQSEKPKTQDRNRNFYYKKNQKTTEVSRMFKKRFSSVIDLNIHHNAIYTKKDFIDLILHMIWTGDYAESGSETLKQKRNKTPDADTFLYHLKNYQNIGQIQRMYQTYFEMIWESARKANMFRKPVDVAIDFTDWFFYGDKNAPMVVEKKPERGTTHCYRFATISIVEPKQRFTLLAIPVGPFDRKETIIRTLLNYASKRVKIKRLYADRGFFDSNSIEIFKRFNIKFIMPCSANSRIKRVLEVMPAPKVITNYVMKNSRFNVVLVEDEYGIKRAFATNIDFDENDVGLSKRLFYLYSKRWGIETGYRVKKHSFRAKTTSKNYFIRLFYFLFSALLYNLWILASIIISLALFGFVKDVRIVKSKFFVSVLLTIDPGG
ncbi:MAG: transposase [Thermoplasmatales archaeon]|nr:transposase [Thermoplasmatales archaeon]